MGKWLEKNGDAIYPVSGCLLRTPPEWGALTGREGKLYLHLFDWKPGPFTLTGLSNQVKNARILATGETLPFHQKKRVDPEPDTLTVTLPEKAPDSAVSEIELDRTGTPRVDETPNDAAGPVILSGFNAEIMSGGDTPEMRVNSTGILENWHDTRDYLRWKIHITTPGNFDADLFTFTERHPDRNPEHWEGGHELTLSNGNGRGDFTVTEEERTYPRDNYQWQIIRSHCGRLSFGKPGIYTIELKARKLNFEKGFGPKVHRIVLSPSG
jgi:alpha-L-fucosidase